MKCRSCGIEIADKALVCYRCGTSTTEAKFKAPPSRPRASRLGLVTTILAVLLALVALYMMQGASVETSRTLRWVVVGFAVVIVVLRGIARRARR